MQRRFVIAAFATMLASGSVAAGEVKSPRDPSSGQASGKVSLQDLHFTSRADAAARCGDAPVTKAADGSFTCSVSKAQYDLATQKK